MNRGRWIRTRLVGGVLLTGVLLAMVLLTIEPVRSEKPVDAPGSAVVFPSNHSVLTRGTFDLICKTPDEKLEVDGAAHRWGPFTSPRRSSLLRLDTGYHTIRVGSEEVEVFVAMTPKDHEGPAEWPVVRSHPMKGKDEERCAACHEIDEPEAPAGAEKSYSVGRLLSYKACFECHPSVEFDVIHSHPLEPIENCEMCHQLHGSPRKAALKAPVKQLCDACHES